MTSNESNQNGNLRFCTDCGNQYSCRTQACPHCGCPNINFVISDKGNAGKDNPILWLPTIMFPLFFILSKNKARAWTARILVVFCVMTVIAGNRTSTSSNKVEPFESNKNISVSKINVSTSSYGKKFNGDCGISASGKMGSDIIGQPTLQVDIFNKSNKTIAAVKFYFIPLNVYGEENKGIFTQNFLYTDSDIRAGESYSASWQFLDKKVKKGKLLVYSIYFSDGTEWGDRDASAANARRYGQKIEITGTSR